MNRHEIQQSRFRKTIGLFVAVLLCWFSFVGQTFAADSEWLVGDDKKIAITTFEHREGASSRATEVTLIVGSMFFKGQLHDTDNGPIKLTRVGAPSSKFDGTIAINYQTKQIKLKGKLDLAAGGTFNLDTTFRCKELPGLDQGSANQKKH